jgi:hypothetical protein
VLLQSEKYDRSRLSSFYGNTTVLALAGYFTGDDRYTRHAARNLKVWPAVVLVHLLSSIFATLCTIDVLALV